MRLMYRRRRLSLGFFLWAGLISNSSAQSAFNINLDAVRRSVVFLHIKDDNGKLIEAGTGFLLVVPTKADATKGYLLIVTARHMVDPHWAGCVPKQGTIFAVFNKRGFDPNGRNPGTVELPLSAAAGGDPNWHYASDDSVDIAFAILAPAVYLGADTDNEPILISQLPTDDEVKVINSGSQIVSAGLLLGASGEKRNYPIFKFGYVSSIPSETVGVSCCPECQPKQMTEWMIAASLVSGNSGSPIFFVPVGFPGIGISNQRAFLLGVQSISFVGSDVSGMAPVRYLLQGIRALNLLDANIPGPIPTVLPSSASPPAPVLPATIPAIPLHR